MLLMSVDSVTSFKSSIAVPYTVSKLSNCRSQRLGIRVYNFLHWYKHEYENKHRSKVDRKHAIRDKLTITKLYGVCSYDKYSPLVLYLDVWDHTTCTVQLNSNCTFRRVINRLEFKIIAQSIHNWLRVHINSSYQGYNIVICLHDSRGYKPLQTIRYLVSEN